MAKLVYLWPKCIGSSVAYSPQNLVAAEREFFGGWSQETEITPRVRIRIDAEIVPNNHADWEVFQDRIAGGTAFFAITNQNMRQRQGWDVFPAVNTSASGAELWRANGKTAAFNGESANPPSGTWRNVLVQAAGAVALDATSIAVDGLLANEVVKAGTPLRPTGQSFRYTVRTDATANGSGAVTLQIAHPLRAAITDNTDIRLPGDLAVYRLLNQTTNPADADGVETVSIEAHEVYQSEITGGFTWVVDL